LFSFRKISIIIFSLLLAFLFLQPVLADDAIIQENNLNVRSGPGTDHDLVGQVNSGEQYEVLEENDAWVNIQLTDYTGWVAKEFITISEENKEPETDDEQKESTLGAIQIQHDNTQIREGASTDYDIMEFVDRDEKFKVLSETGDWLEISDGKITGFVLRELVEQNKKSGTNNGLKHKTIVIDAGHGGRDVGAIGVNGSYEKDITYLTAHELEKELLSLGANVILTRPKNEYVPLESRASLANTIDTDAFISLHYNSFPASASASGIDSFYYHDQYEVLASYIHHEIIKETDESDRGIHFGDFHVLRQNFKPGVLLELGFLSNEEKEAQLKTTGYQKKIVTGIVNGLQKYFSYIED